MSRLPGEFHQDRILRDAARDVLMADIEHARHSLSREGLTARVAGRIGDGTKDVLHVAKGHSDDNRGVIAALIALLALWLARKPLMEIIGLAPEAGENEEDGALSVDEEPRESEPPVKSDAASGADNDIKAQVRASDTAPADDLTTGEFHD